MYARSFSFAAGYFICSRAVVVLMDSIKVGSLTINSSELRFSFDRSPGPGGQNVNKLNTRVEMRFDVLNSKSVPESARARIVEGLGRRVSKDGILIIRSSRYRSQLRNKQECIDKFAAKLGEIFKPPLAKRRVTRPSGAEMGRRRQANRRNSKKKKLRKRPDLD